MQYKAILHGQQFTHAVGFIKPQTDLPGQTVHENIFREHSDVKSQVGNESENGIQCHAELRREEVVFEKELQVREDQKRSTGARDKDCKSRSKYKKKMPQQNSYQEESRLILVEPVRL